MPDISMCLNNDCSIKDSCYRFKAIPSDYQYYCDFKFNPNGSCDDFLHIIDTEDVIDLLERNLH